jgi:hypothetical protein
MRSSVSTFCAWCSASMPREPAISTNKSAVIAIPYKTSGR